ncbi:hypothetical protein [Tepidibacillus decaturensis]|nr:hypothetical protein [Tepidibacillus decaturensis]
MGKLIDEVHYYSRVVKMLKNSNDQEVAGALKYYTMRLRQVKSQLKEAIV